MSIAHGARNPVATSCTFSTTAGPILGEAVGVGLAVDGAAVVGIGIVVVVGEELADGGTRQDIRRRAMTAAAPRVTRGSGLRASR
jgi:hypothetical protein